MRVSSQRNQRSRVTRQLLFGPLLLFLAAGAGVATERQAAAPGTDQAALERPAAIGLQNARGRSVAEIAPAPLIPADSAVRGPAAPRFAPQGISALAAAPTITGFTATPAPPKPYGTTITWTVTATGGVAPLQYSFYRYNVGTATWSLVQAYSTTRTYAWTPTVSDIGSYQLQVWVRNAGSTATYDAWAGYPTFSVLNNLPVITSITANATFPKRVGSAITWTTNVSGGVAPLQYQYNRYSYATAAWSVVQPYGISKTFSWTPTNADIGRYALQVWVRNAGSTATYDAWAGFGDFDLTGVPPTITSFAANVTFPAPAGQPITWTAIATGGVGPLKYAFYRYSATTGWTLAQAYSSSNTFTWIPAATDVGQFQLQVWVLNAGSTIPYDAYAGMAFSLGPVQPLGVASFGSLPPLPRPQGSILVFKVGTTGGVWPLSYSFYRYSYQTSAWTLVQPWGPNDTYTWTPSATEVGDYQIQVWVRNAGSTATYDALSGLGRFTITSPDTDIVRFLEQATWGPTNAEIARVRQMGESAWIDDQFAQPPTGLGAYPIVPDNPAGTCTGTCLTNNYSLYLPLRQTFLNALYNNDQLRQRVAWALHSLVVVSGFDVPMPSWFQPYFDTIYRNAFGNYRQLLYDVTLNPAMGDYLNLNTSTKVLPNENYPREIMQLFALGTDLLKTDGTPQRLANGDIIPTYDQFVVTEMARALTGWRFANQLGTGITNYRDPMVSFTANHDLGSKFLLNGFTTTAGVTADQDLNDAIDNIFNHPNVGPYVARYLIRRLVTSNPPPDYVERVATVFNNNGSGVRGDLKAVVKAILLDPVARNTSTTRLDPRPGGHLKEPLLFATHLLRAVGATSANGLTTSDGYLAPSIIPMGQDVLRPATVFSYYPAENALTGTSVVAPEFGIYDSTTTLKRANFVNTMVFGNIPTSANAPNGTALDLSLLTALAAYPNTLIQELNRLLLHDSMSPQMKSSLLTAINAVPASNLKLRAQTALYLVATSSQYQVER